jgi:hypothetical protein
MEDQVQRGVRVRAAEASPEGAISSAIQPRTSNSTPVLAQSCPTCSSPLPGPDVQPSFVYAIGRIEPRYPRPSVEKEFAQVAGRSETTNLTDGQTLSKILQERKNRYLLRQLCWVLSIGNLETYLLLPRDPVDFDLLVESLRSTPRPTDLDVVIGLKGPIAKQEMCNGLMIPILFFDQIYSFDREALIGALPRPQKRSKEFGPAAEELLDRLMQVTDNAGATDDHRALNYLAVRYSGIYTMVADQFSRNSSLSDVEVRAAPLSGARRVVDVIFSFTNRTTDVVAKFSVRVDVSEEFPFLISKLSPYYDR